ncbi:MAG: hypothetical protein R6X19_01460 [Kiritimatiellia bacterium]
MKFFRLSPSDGLWIGGALILRLVFLLCFYDHFVDDSYIFMRYAEHFTEGNGLVYNLGERVMGFTSLTYTLLVAALTLLFRGVSSSALMAGLNMTVFILFGLLIVRLVRGYVLRSSMLALFFFFFPFVDASLSGMESFLFCLFLAATFISSDRGAWKLACLSAALAFATRPEGVFLLVPVLVLAAMRLPRRDFLVTVGGLAVMGGVVLLALYGYYGSPIPHSMIAKSVLTNSLRWAGVESSLFQKAVMLAVGASDLYCRALPLAARIGLGGITALGLLLGLWGLSRIRERPTAALAVVFYLSVLVFYWLGNPVRIFSWYTIPTCFCFWFAAFSGLEKIAARMVSPRGVRWLTLTVMGLCLLSNTALIHRLETTAAHAGDLHRMAKILKRDYPEGRCLMIADIGIVGYETGFRIVDLAGLVTPQAVAESTLKAPSFGTLVEQTSPDLICLKNNPLEAESIVESMIRYRSFEDALQKGRFLRTYSPTNIGSSVCPFVFVRGAKPLFSPGVPPGESLIGKGGDPKAP